MASPSPSDVSEVSSDPAQVQIRIEAGSRPRSMDKVKAFLTQPRTASKLSATTDVSAVTRSPHPSEPKTSSQKGKKGSRGRNKEVPTREENTNDSGIEDERNSPAAREARESRLAELDKLYPVPEGWPRLHDKIFRRRALFFRKPVSLGVEKVLGHLRALQDRIEEWSREVELEILSRRSSVAEAEAEVAAAVAAAVASAGGDQTASVMDKGSSRMTTSNSRKHLRFAAESALSDVSLDDLASSTDSGRPSALRTPRGGSSLPSARTAVTSGSHDQLSIQGVGATVPKVEAALTVDLEDELPKLGAEEVIDAVMVLVGRLESDRRDTQSLYEREGKRVQWLQSKIDRLASRRMLELPRAVQKEHEACATDIAELKWHCAYRSRQKGRIETHVETAEIMNARLLEDIAFVQKHCPLVEEKLELERDAMKRIDEAQIQTTDMLNQTFEKLKRTEDKSAEAHGKADMERAHIKRELEGVRDALREINAELDEAKALHMSYANQCTDLRLKLRQNAEEKIVLLNKCENSKAAEKIQASRVKAIQEKIIEAEFEHRKRADHNFQLTSQIERMRNQQTKEVEDLEAACKIKLAELRERQQGCRQMSMEIEDTEQKLKKCAKQQIADTKNTHRIKREMTKVDTQLTVVDEEFEKIRTINTAVRNKLIGEEDKAQMMEDTLQGTSDSLRKQVKEETHARTVLQARISSDTADLAKQQTEAKKKKAKVAKKASELEQVVAKILADVKVLRDKHAQRQQTVSDLHASLADLKRQQEETQKSRTEMISKLEPDCEALKKAILDATKRMDYMAYRMDLIKRKLTDMDKSQGFMKKVIQSAEESITVLSEDLEELTIQLTTGQKQQDELKGSLTEVAQRMEEGGSKHLEHMKERREVLETMEADLKGKLRENKTLARQYRREQQAHLKLKESLLDGLDGRITLEASLKDHKQLSGLQLRLHHALVHYYRIRGLFNQNELMRFEEMSGENSQRVQALQTEMDQAIRTISGFLTDQLDGTAAGMVQAAAKAAMLKEDTATAVGTTA